MKLFDLPNHKGCRIEGLNLRVGRVTLQPEDTAELVRVYLTSEPLIADDPRLKLLDEVRATVIKQDRPSGQRWLILFFRNKAKAAA